MKEIEGDLIQLAEQGEFDVIILAPLRRHSEDSPGDSVNSHSKGHLYEFVVRS